MKKRIIQSLLAIVCCVTVALSAIPTAEAAMRASVVTGKVQLELYLEAAKESPQKSSEYAYFPNDDLRLAHEQSNMRLISFEIESSTKINDKLYEYNVLIKTDFAPEEYTRVYYFVGNIDGELKFIVNASFVPDELSDGLDVGAYSYGEEDSSSVIFEN